MSNIKVAWIAILFLIAGIGIGEIAGEIKGSSSERKCAIRAKAGRWTINPITGQVDFKYGCENDNKN